MKILFVCTQNVFRSMSAMYLMKKYLDDNGISDISVGSCGTVAHSFENPYQRTIENLYRLGVDAREHKNVKVDEEILIKSDLIICMSEQHRKDLKENFGFDSYLFNEVAHGKETDLQDDVEGEYTDLNEFIDEVTNHIDKSIPLIYENLGDYV